MKKTNLVLAVLVALILATTASAQTNSGESDITLSAELSESLTVSLSAATINFTLTAASSTNAGAGSVDITTSWVLDPSRSAVKLFAYFDSSSAALSGSSDDVPSAAVAASLNGSSIGFFSNTVAFGGANAGVQLFSQAITDANRNDARTDALTLNIDLSSIGQLPADTYTGTLHIQAQATT